MPDPAKSALAKQFARWKEADAAARLAWESLDKATLRLLKLARMGRKVTITVRISETRGLLLVDEYRKAIRAKDYKIFTPAYCKRVTIKEIALE